MPRQVLCISSQVAYGPVGNTAAVPALQAAGFNVLQIPTIVMSNHPGLAKPSGVKLPATEISAILASLEALGVLQECVGVMTGYFTDAEQIKTASSFVADIKERNSKLFVLVDPVLGDDGSLYVSKDVANALRDDLVPLATCVTPNCFELSWLTGLAVTNRQDAVNAAAKLAAAEILATSIPVGHDHLATLAVTRDGCSETISPLRSNVPHGTGDFLAGLYLASRLNGFAPPEALKLSAAILETAISRSLDLPYLDIIGALHSPA